jgi:PleD family two-component response regulator
MSVSCGVSVYKKGVNIEEVVETADQQMYQDKKRQQSSA